MHIGQVREDLARGLLDRGLGRGRVEREGASGRGRVGVTGRIAGPDREGVGAVGECRGRVGRRAGREVAAVERALESGAGL